jgi:hypothetical protein
LGEAEEKIGKEKKLGEKENNKKSILVSAAVL